MQTFTTAKPLQFYPKLTLRTSLGRDYFACDGDPINVPAGSPVISALPPASPGRLLICTTAGHLYRYCGTEDLSG